ncbi:MAG: ATP-binding protein [Gemmatimonadaceae bacterium]
MTLRTRLSLGIAAVALVLVLPQLLSIRALRSVDRSMARLRTQEFGASLLVGRMRAAAEELAQLDLASYAVPDSAGPRERLEAQLDTLARLTDSLRALKLEGEARAGRAQVDTLVRSTALQRQLARAGRVAEAERLSDSVSQPAIAALERTTRRAEAQLSRRTSERVDAAEQLTRQARDGSIAALLVALALAALIAALLTRSISNPVRDLELGMAAVADGDLDHRLRIPSDRRDEFGRLAVSYQAMTAQLAELDKLKAEFVSVASHELKTPINVILGYLQLLDENVYGDLTPKQREILRTLTTQSHTLNRLVKHLLDISRFEAGGGRVEPRPMNLDAFLRDLEEAFQVLAHQREVEFELVRDEGLPDEVCWDPDRVNEVLGNLLSNAFKFTERGGLVQLVATPVAGKVQLEVRDTGAGIPPEQLPRIFEKFYQADNQGAASAKGTGLGLAIAKGIVDAHGGTISVASTPGHGTTFTIVMPAEVHGHRRTYSHPHAVMAETAAT